MRKIILIGFLATSVTIVNAQTWNKIKSSVPKNIKPSSSALSEEEVGKGLKEALNKGVEKGVGARGDRYSVVSYSHSR